MPASEPSPPPALLLRGARVPGRGGAPVAHPVGGPVELVPCDVLLAGGVVRALGPRLGPAEVAQVLPGGTEPEVLDLAGRCLLPGLWDHHVHLGQLAATRRRLDLAGAGSAAHAVELVLDRLRSGPPPAGDLLIGFGFRDGLWPDRPHRALLDTALADAGVPASVAVVLASGDLHCGWLNTAATVRFARAGHPDGVLREEDWYPVLRSVDDLPPDVLDAWVAETAATAAARGVVGVVELEQAHNVDVWTRRVRAGTRSLRIAAGLYRPHLADAIARGLRTGDVLPGTDGLVTMGPFKAVTDGSLNTRTAYCLDPYPGTAGHPHPCGLLVLPPHELTPLMRRAAAHGIACAVHAIGDHANQLTLDAFAATGARGTVEHAQLLTAADLARFAALDVVASVQPEHLSDDRDVADRHWAGRTGRAFPFADLLAVGARLVLGSDAPVAPLDPWVTVAAAVHRTRDGRPPWHPEQAIDVTAALAASTATGRVGLWVGDRADVIVLERDPFTADAEALRRMPVSATYLAGRPTHPVP